MCLRAIRYQLSDTMHAHKQGDPTALVDSVQKLSARGTLVHILGALGEDQRLLAETAARSYLHANGFVKITLLEGCDYKLRLHLWWPQVAFWPDRRLEDVHNHRWDFATSLLEGSYRYQEFHGVEAGETYYAYRYRSPESSEAYPLDALGTSELACVFDAFLPRGVAYTLRADVLHRVVQQGNRLTASLMLQTSPRRDSTDVFTERDLGDSVSVPVRRMTPGQLSHHVRNFLDLTSG